MNNKKLFTLVTVVAISVTLIITGLQLQKVYAVDAQTLSLWFGGISIVLYLIVGSNKETVQVKLYYDREKKMAHISSDEEFEFEGFVVENASELDGNISILTTDDEGD